MDGESSSFFLDVLALLALQLVTRWTQRNQIAAQVRLISAEAMKTSTTPKWWPSIAASEPPIPRPSSNKNIKKKKKIN